MSDIVAGRFSKGMYGLLRLLAFPEKLAARRASKRRWYSKHREQRRLYKQEYYKNNRDTVEKGHRRYYLANRDAVKLAARKYRVNNLEKCKARRKIWESKNLGKMRAFSAKYKALKRTSVNGSIAAIESVYKRAVELRRWFAVEVDHIKPLSIGGLHEASNLQIIYAFENRRKCDSLNYKPSVVFR